MIYLLISKLYFRVPAPRSNQAVVCPKLYAVKMVSQKYQIFFKFRFCEREHLTYKVIHIYFLFKGKDGKDGQNGEIFNNFSLLFYSGEVFIANTVSTIRVRLTKICF